MAVRASRSFPNDMGQQRHYYGSTYVVIAVSDQIDNTNPFDKHVKLGASTEAIGQFVQDLNARQKDGGTFSSDNRPLKSASSLLLDTAQAVPAATARHLLNDLASDKSHVAAQLATGTALGAGFTVAFKVAPRLGYAGAALLAAKGLYDLGSGTEQFVSKANTAPDRKSQELLAQNTASKVGRTLADSTEALPGMVVGGFGATKVVGVPRLYAEAGSMIVDPVKNRLAFMGPGVRSLPAHIDRGATMDTVSLSRILSSEHPWQGIETGRTVDLATMKLSRQVSGSETRLSHLPASEKLDTVTFHTHSPKRGAYPGLDDIIGTTNIGIISSGPETVLYIGQRTELTQLMRAGKADSFEPQLRAVARNDIEGTARRLVGTWDSTLRGWRLQEQPSLDYTKTIEALQNLDKTAPSVWQALLRLPAHIQ